MSCGGQLAGIVGQQSSSSPGAAEGHQEPVATLQGQHVPAELTNAGHSAPGTETHHEAFGAESLPRHEDNDERGLH